VKTTDYVTVQLEKLAVYREKLVSENAVDRSATILIVVGREDTGALEAQVRGSRYAWDMRMISIEGLIKLVQIKEKSDDPATLMQIRQLLQPFEYTKVDRIIDVIFTTALDVAEQETEEEATSKEEEPEHSQARTDPELLNAKRRQAVAAFAKLKAKEVIQKSRTLHWSPDRTFRVCCAVSKRYESDYQPYWYAYHSKWDDFLRDGTESYCIFSCMDQDIAYAVPFSWFANNKQNLNMTDRSGKPYWHIAFTTLEGGALAINLSRIGTKTPLQPYAFKLS
jgi:hypothetical protein